jgi:hypothetical protein
MKLPMLPQLLLQLQPYTKAKTSGENSEAPQHCRMAQPRLKDQRLCWT